MSVLTWDRIMRGTGFQGYGASSCPAHTHPGKNNSCCISASQRPPNAPKKAQCCPAGKTTVVTHPGGISLSCKGGGGGGGGNGGGGSKPGTEFKVVSVTGSTLTADRVLSGDCGSNTPELRRPRTSGLQEFGGDITSVSGKTVVFSPGPTPPKAGDTFIIYCAHGGGGSSTGGGGGISDFVDSITGGGGIPTWVWLAGGGVLIYMLVSKSSGNK